MVSPFRWYNVKFINRTKNQIWFDFPSQITVELVEVVVHRGIKNLKGGSHHNTELLAEAETC